MTAVVYQEHTLGILGDNGWIQPLRSSVIKGAPFRVHDEPFCPATPNDIRPATRADFDDYRVRYHPDYRLTEPLCPQEA